LFLYEHLRRFAEPEVQSNFKRHTMTDRLMHSTITIQGAVQGVGFRPFVFRIARQMGVCGFVRNDGRGVFISAFAKQSILDAFVRTLQTTHPPLAVIRHFSVSPMTITGETLDSTAPQDFTIVQSNQGERIDVDITRDAAVCDNCLSEMRDPNNRRYRHPFINCTDCGPRFTIIKKLPYDRPYTTMADFAMCDECKKEYESPGNRRFHAQPICCPSCGPTLKLTDSNGAIIPEKDPISQCKRMFGEGLIVAIKGIGGYHLACAADNDSAVSVLRQRKRREEKPFALMVRDIEAAGKFVHIGPREKTLLESVERPIVLCRKKENAVPLAMGIAPGVPTLGIMLPYTPIHHLLFAGSRLNALVMTSANTTDEPIAFKNEDALNRLSGIADAFLMHDRDIHIRNDDSIARVCAHGPLLLRRSRGFVPEALDTLHEVQGVVALGGVLKSTAAVGRGRMAYSSQYVGEVANLETLEDFKSILFHLLRVLNITPTQWVCDLHPGGMTRIIAQDSGLPLMEVQHHHAHAVACMAENELTENALCVVYDGTGYGTDGALWGGEIFHTTHADFTRLGHLTLLPLPGGEQAIRHPGRIAVAALYGILGENAADACPWMQHKEKAAVIDMVKSNISCPKTSSMGRLFDAASALLGIGKNRTYEGQPAIELEGCADARETSEYDPGVSSQNGLLLIDGPKILAELYRDFKSGTPSEKASARFHNTIAKATALAVRKVADTTGCSRVCLSGGCFQNALLLEKTLALLSDAGLETFTHHRTPPNDECISFGQIVVAGARREQ
jgi:hydrogenase maturation protein HypF